MGKGNKKGPGADGTEEENGTKKSDEEKTDETGEEEANDQDGDGEVRDSSGQIIDVDDDINDLQLAPGRRSKPSFSERRAAKRIQKANAQLRAQDLKTEFVDAYRRRKDSDRAALESAVQQAKQALEDASQEHGGGRPSGDKAQDDVPHDGASPKKDAPESLGTVSTGESSNPGGKPGPEGLVPKLGSDEHDDIVPDLRDDLAPAVPSNPINDLSDALEQESNPVSKPSNTYDNYLKTSGYIMDLAGAFTGSATATANIIETQASDTKNLFGVSEKDQVKAAAAPLRRINSGINAVSGTWGSINNLIGFGKSMGARKSHNKRVRNGAGLGMLANGLGFFGNASKIVTGGIGVFGDSNDTDQKNASAWVGTAGNAFSTAASITTWVNNYRDRVQRRALVGDTSDYVRDNAAIVAGTAEGDAKNAAQAAIQGGDVAGYAANKTALNEIKAKKYAMQQAATMNQFKSRQGPKGAVGSIVGGINTIASLVGAIAPGARLVTGAITGITGALGNLVKQHELASDLMVRDKLREEKMNVVNKYVQDKISKLDNDISDYEGRTGTQLNMTPKEKKRIIIARLGVDLEITDTDPSTSEMESAFDFINHKRALYIMNSSKDEREEMLDALHLDYNATLKDIESVLRGD